MAIQSILKNLTDTPAWRAVRALISGDDLVEQNLDVPLQDLADRTKWLKDSLALVPSAIYPVGSLYLNASDTRNPSVILGFGTWLSFGAGQMLLGVGSGYNLGGTGGAATHTLTTAEMPVHNHGVQRYAGSEGTNYGDHISAPTNGASYDRTGSTGGGAGHNNMPPYIVVNIWKRTA